MSAPEAQTSSATEKKCCSSFPFLASLLSFLVGVIFTLGICWALLSYVSAAKTFAAGIFGFSGATSSGYQNPFSTTKNGSVTSGTDDYTNPFEGMEEEYVNPFEGL